jgi:phage nucleotide-binding protein
MSLIKQPSQLEVSPALVAMIYGQPGLGKSTLACSAPDAVMFDFDGGVHRINGAHKVPTVQVRSWEEAVQALDEVRSSLFKTIIIDTVGKMMMFMEDYIKRTDPKMKQADGSLSLKGYGKRKQMFITFNNDVRAIGRNIIYVAHEIEQKRGEDTTIRPEVGGSSVNDLIKELDLVGYMEAFGKQRTITFDPQQKFYAKNTCGLYGVIQVPTLIDDQGRPTGKNDFFSRVIDAYHKRLSDDVADTTRFEALVAEITENIQRLHNADDANNFVEWMQQVEHVYNSRAVALEQFQARIKQLNITYDATTKKYTDVA